MLWFTLDPVNASIHWRETWRRLSPLAYIITIHKQCRVTCAHSSTRQAHAYLNVILVRVNTLHSAKHGHVIARLTTHDSQACPVVTSAHVCPRKEKMSQSRQGQLCVCVCVCVCPRRNDWPDALSFVLVLYTKQTTLHCLTDLFALRGSVEASSNKQQTHGVKLHRHARAVIGTTLRNRSSNAKGASTRHAVDMKGTNNCCRGRKHGSQGLIALGSSLGQIKRLGTMSRWWRNNTDACTAGSWWWSSLRKCWLPR